MHGQIYNARGDPNFDRGRDLEVGFLNLNFSTCRRTASKKKKKKKLTVIIIIIHSLLYCFGRKRFAGLFLSAGYRSRYNISFINHPIGGRLKPTEQYVN